VLDLEKGETLFLPNLSGTWPHVPLRDTIARLMGLPTAILNDARSITLGEWRFGAGQGLQNVVVLTLGTGIGGGLVINGRLHLGSSGTAGELGHMTIDYNGPRCGCGNYGCLEVFASGPAIALMGVKAVAQGLTTQIGELCEFDLNRVTPKLIARAARAGDEIALEIYNQAGFYLGVAASSICAAFAPQRIILSGGVSRAGKLLLYPMTRTMRERTHIMDINQVDIVQGELGDNAGVIGASVWAASLYA
jgi:glucokinase